MSGCPCKDCISRTVTCHGVCGRYQEWKKAHEEELAVKRVEKAKMGGITQRARAAWEYRTKRRNR